nr:hypothetical protein GCM10020093_068470 [Planobispora longispora]
MNGPTSDDSALTRLVRAGDSHAVAELYERHHAAVLAFARRLCPDPYTAEDLASEAFARTLRTVRTGAAGPSGGWRPYLYAVVRNTAAEWAHSDQRRVLTAEFREDDLTVAGPEPPDDLVTRAYRSLPPRWQTVLWHTVIEDEEPEQIAKILGITPVTWACWPSGHAKGCARRIWPPTSRVHRLAAANTPNRWRRPYARRTAVCRERCARIWSPARVVLGREANCSISTPRCGPRCRSGCCRQPWKDWARPSRRRASPAGCSAGRPPRRS